MKHTKIANNLTKIDASPNGIFFMSYSTPIAMIKGHDEWMSTSDYSATTRRHKKKLMGKYITPSAQPMLAEVMGKLCEDAGIDCDY